MALRPYQQDAVNAAISWMKKCIMPACMELSVGAGKSWILAYIASWVYENTGKKTLVFQPSRELVEQNYEKFLATGKKASIFSASAGSKCMRHNVIYATPGTVKGSLSRFGDAFGVVLIDECDQTTPTIRMIIDSMRKANPNLRVIGVTGTPYTTRNGFIYRYDLDGSFVPEDQARDPYYNSLLYRIKTRDLIDMGFLTMAHADPEMIASYKTGSLQLNSRGKFDPKDVEKVFEGRGRLTSQIIKDVVSHSSGRMGVMIFAATVQHAKEIMESLPPENSRMIGGDVNMKEKDRERLISDFKNRKFKYIVNVQTLNVGFDAPHVDTIAILRKTESARLFQQIMGRGLRLHDEKTECLILDYAENVDFHNLHDDLFTPEIRVRGGKSESFIVEASCPECSFVNEFSGRPNPDEYQVSVDGYFLDLAGHPIATDNGPMPAHFGRRCTGQVKSLLHRGVYERCEYRWTSKECPDCKHPNDIAARYCESCKAEIIDPNAKLQMEFQKVKADPYEISTDRILFWTASKSVSQSGKDTLVCEYTTDYRTFKIWYTPESRHPKAQYAWKSLNDAVYSGHVAPDVDTFLQYLDKGRQPETITCHRERGSKFFRVIAHNRPEDTAP